MGWCSVLPARIVLVLSSGCPTCRARAFQWLSSLPCSCAGAGRSNAAFWNKCISRVSMESSGDMSHQSVCCGGLSSPAVTSLRCIRPVRDEDVQGILVGFQGDGNERSGHPSHPLTPPQASSQDCPLNGQRLLLDRSIALFRRGQLSADVDHRVFLSILYL